MSERFSRYRQPVKKGKRSLRNRSSRQGMVLDHDFGGGSYSRPPRPPLPEPFFNGHHGAAYLGDALSLMASLEDESVDLVVTSPPFALTRKKEYGNEDAHRYVTWFLPFGREIHRILKLKGSFVLDLGGAYLPGAPIRSLYQYELLLALCREVGFFLAQDLYHYNPARLPTPAEWVTVRRVRVKDCVNVAWWLSKSQNPKADNRKVLRPYSQSMLDLLRNGYKPKLRPSGHDISNRFQTDNGGAIPPNVLQIANTESNSAYLRKCREAGVKPHPARFPIEFPAFFIRLCTDQGDRVLDPFAGSNVTGLAAEHLGRRWLGFEIREDYLVGAKFRFEDESASARLFS